MNKHVSIRLKIGVVTLVGVMTFIGFLSYIYWVENHNKLRIQHIRDHAFPKLELIDKVVHYTETMKEQFAWAVGTAEQETIDEAEETAQKVLQFLDRIRRIDAGDTQNVDAIRNIVQRYRSAAVSFARAMIRDEEGGGDTAAQIETMKTAYTSLQKNLIDFREVTYLNFTGSLQDIHTDIQSALRNGLVIGIFMALVLFTVSSVVSSLIVSSVNRVARSLEDIASKNGDLSVRIASPSRDELGILVHWFNTFVAKLQTIVRDAVSTSGQLTVSASQLREVADAAETTIARQRADTEAVADACAQMSDTIAHVAGSAVETAATTNEVKTVTENALDRVAEAIEAVNSVAVEVKSAGEAIAGLQAVTSDIYGILDVIRDISDQTNLLALNASIEAARAGDNGRGFAVVADEVRVLAGRTQKSIEDIQNIIKSLKDQLGTTVEIMERGERCTETTVAISEETGRFLEKVVAGISGIHTRNNQIATASEQLSQTAQGIEKSVSSFKEATEQTHQLARQTSQASEQLSEVSAQLERILGVFRLSDNDAA